MQNVFVCMLTYVLFPSACDTGNTLKWAIKMSLGLLHWFLRCVLKFDLLHFVLLGT